MKNLKKFMWLFFIVFGLVFVCCGVWLTKTAITFKNEGVLTQATIIRIDMDYGADDEIAQLTFKGLVIIQAHCR